MEYSNEKIKQLVEQRNRIDREINMEIEKEKAKYKFSWGNFFIVIGLAIVPYIMYKINITIFSPDSIWSWDYWLK